jgi:hypothetical protein
LKAGKNIYIPSFVDTVIDFCAFNAHQSDNLLVNFIPTIREMFDKYLHRCPYTVRCFCFAFSKSFLIDKIFSFQGEIVIKDYNVDGEVFSKFLPTGSYKFDYRFYDANNGTFLCVSYYFFITKTRM